MDAVVYNLDLIVGLLRTLVSVVGVGVIFAAAVAVVLGAIALRD